MAATIKVNIDPKTIILNRHLEKGGAAQRFFTSELKRLSDPYTPFDNGILKSNVDVKPDKIIYKVPYARYQWQGVAMEGTPRVPTERPLNYQGSPIRGRQWVLRCWADKGKKITESVAKFVGGKAI